ncbi:hypothetical protein [Acinetobacter haemolyticus]|uniref:hypothetical protein n=1 Tax=Acinetobacter haemolyticus TaxID=29430 RepID=UPI0021CDE437|nr:hypothetical protein [Acinetobacter haemolyticus]MCU4378278.1 hypothetical protein [Acinetobacter haemolyticus]WPO67560.1 hypothetical protein SDC64_01015 [Acinetobacter haemolyticus]
MKLSVIGTLPVALTILVDGKAFTSKEVEFSDISSIELLAARGNAIAGDFLSIHEFAAKTKLLDDKGNKYEVPYSVLAASSGANFKKLEDLEYELLVKLQAESLEIPSN